MTAQFWTDEFLDAMRTQGDPLADEAVAALLAREDERAVQRLMDSLVRNDQVVPQELGPELVRYFDAIAGIPPPVLARVEQGERFFAAYGPEILLVLGCFSLPASYAARKGVQVLYRTGYLARRPNRRLFETTQMVIDVMSPGGLGPQGRGIRTAQKVRLMHAAIRHLILTDAAQPWDTASLGVPINQEDLAGTLMTFSQVVLEGLERLRVEVDPDEAAAYLDAWRAVGALMGIRPELIPATLAEAATLTRKIQQRQVAASKEGKQMTAALIGMFDDNLPPALYGVPPALIRTFLEPYPGVADDLGIPEHRLEDRLVAAAATIGGEVAGKIEGSVDHHALLRKLSLMFLQFIVDADRGGKRAAFNVPTELDKYWKRPPEPHLSFWARLRRWVLGWFRRG